jgi:hypothetical protein
VLGAGQGARYRADALVELANAGQSDAVLVGGGVFGILDTAAMPAVQEGYAIGGYAESASGLPVDSPDIALTLERTTIAAGGSLAAPPGQQAVVLGVDESVGALRVGFDGQTTNPGDAPAAVYVLRVAAAAGATPAATPA